MTAALLHLERPVAHRAQLCHVLQLGSNSKRAEGTRGALQGSILLSALFSVFINDLNSGLECILRKFVGYTKLGGAPESGRWRGLVDSSWQTGRLSNHQAHEAQNK